jgi:hypothetical protein
VLSHRAGRVRAEGEARVMRSGVGRFGGHMRVRSIETRSRKLGVVARTNPGRFARVRRWRRGAGGAGRGAKPQTDREKLRRQNHESASLAPTMHKLVRFSKKRRTSNDRGFVTFGILVISVLLVFRNGVSRRAKVEVRFDKGRVTVVGRGLRSPRRSGARGPLRCQLVA